MTSNELELFMGAGRSLADRTGLPATRPQMSQSWNPGEIHTIRTGKLLGQIGILPQQVDRVTLAGYGGDEEMIRQLKGHVENGVLSIEGALPFKSGTSGSSRSFGYGGSQFNVFGGSGVFMTGSGSVFVGDGHVSVSGQNMLIIDGREVDLERHVQIALIVPFGTNVRIDNTVGAIGIGPNLGGTLDVNTQLNAHVFAYDVTELTGDISGSGELDVQTVYGPVEFEISGSGKGNVGSVSDKVDVSISGSGKFTVGGGNSTSLRARVSGSGKIVHRGTVTGSAKLRVSGSGTVTAERVLGTVDPQVTGSGKIKANGETYRPRW